MGIQHEEAGNYGIKWYHGAGRPSLEDVVAQPHAEVGGVQHCSTGPGDEEEFSLADVQEDSDDSSDESSNGWFFRKYLHCLNSDQLKGTLM